MAAWTCHSFAFSSPAIRCEIDAIACPRGAVSLASAPGSVKPEANDPDRPSAGARLRRGPVLAAERRLNAVARHSGATITGVISAKRVGRIRSDPGMAGLVVPEPWPTSSGAKAKTDGSLGRGGTAPSIASKGVAAGQVLTGAGADGFASATWVGHPGCPGHAGRLGRAGVSTISRPAKAS